MFCFFNNVPIKSKLPLTVCLLVVLAVTLPATQSYFDQKAALEEHLEARFDDSLAPVRSRHPRRAADPGR
ncbi:MAG: hypothetical protein OIF48_07810 [Silicimonas sp.]|nr:hypothetical protein [Silicimonas sp.]